MFMFMFYFMLKIIKKFRSYIDKYIQDQIELNNGKQLSKQVLKEMESSDVKLRIFKKCIYDMKIEENNIEYYLVATQEITKTKDLIEAQGLDINNYLKFHYFIGFYINYKSLSKIA